VCRKSSHAIITDVMAGHCLPEADSCRVLCAFVRPRARSGRRKREDAGRLQGQHKAVEEVPGIGPGYVRSSMAATAASSSWISASISVASLRCS
jgi:hypothetical protein